jgi:hypothetical protein
MRSIDFTSLTQTALILTFSPGEKEMVRAPLRNGDTRYRVRSSLPLGETLAKAAVRVREWLGERVMRGVWNYGAQKLVQRYRMSIG